MATPTRNNNLINRVGFVNPATRPPSDVQASSIGQNSQPQFGTPADVVQANNQYGQAQAFSAVDQLKALRAQLDAGQIDPATFIAQAKPLHSFVDSEFMRLTQSGHEPAGVGNQLRQLLDSTDTGFKTNYSADPGSDNRYSINLPGQYQQQLRESLIPSNITGDQRQALLNDIPNDVQYGSDQWKSEAEGVRQKIQDIQGANDEATKRKQYVNDLAGVLGKANNDQFNVDKTGILEDLQGRGLLNSSEVGNQFAQRKQQLSQTMDSQLAQQSIGDENAVLPLYQQAIANQQQFQSAGISRNFSLQDATTSLNNAIKLGLATQPKQAQGLSKGQQTGLAVVQGAAGGAGQAAGAKAATK